MTELLNKTFDFGIRVIELCSYLDDEKKRFPLINRLLECGTGIGICLRVSEVLHKSRQAHSTQAHRLAVETEYLLELLVKTGFLSEYQSKPILSDCRSVKDEIEKQMGKRAVK